MKNFYEQYQFNVNRGPWFEDATSLPTTPPSDYPIRMIAYYLPQFHAIPENDSWWGTGFTEWTNVTKSLPRYVGHRQPRLPGDFGFYDLRQVDTLRRQAVLARRAGIYGFCIHNYWFSGRQILETPLRLLLDNPDIDLPFCLNWANENWTRRWDGAESQVLLKQDHHSVDNNSYIKSILPALHDRRYIRVNGRPLIMVYRPGIIPAMSRMVDNWREFLVAEGIGDPYIVMAQVFDDEDPRPYGMDAAAGFPPHNITRRYNRRHLLKNLDPTFCGVASPFQELAEQMLRKNPKDYCLFPGVSPSWDNEARRPGRGTSFYGSTPEAYGKWLDSAARRAAQVPNKQSDNKLLFLNAWNEWAEGAVLEPDRHYGHAFLAETRRIFDSLRGDPGRQHSSPELHIDERSEASTSILRLPSGGRRWARERLGKYRSGV